MMFDVKCNFGFRNVASGRVVTFRVEDFSLRVEFTILLFHFGLSFTEVIWSFLSKTSFS